MKREARPVIRPASHRERQTSSELQVDVLGSGRVALLRLDGCLDAASAPVLEAQVDAVLRTGCHDLVLDCGSLGFCDSAGLRTLVRSHRSLPDGGTCTLVRPSDTLLRILEVAGLGSAFEVAGSAT